MKKIRVVIFGCGKIGALWDLGTFQSKYKLTHLSGFSSHKGYEIVALCDTNSKLNIPISKKIKVPFYNSIDKLISATKFDLAIIATPSNIRFSLIEKLVENHTKFFIIEKPVALSSKEGIKIERLFNNYSVKPIINFSRRWNSAFTKLKFNLNDEIGSIQRCVGFYGKGLFNNGSHLLDLVIFLTGAKPIKTRSLGHCISESKIRKSKYTDLSLDAQVLFQYNSKNYFIFDMKATNHKFFSFFSLEFFGSNGRCEINESEKRINFYKIKESIDYKGYMFLNKRNNYLSIVNDSINNLVSDAFIFFTRKMGNSDTFLSSLVNIKVLEGIRQSESKKGVWINI